MAGVSFLISLSMFLRISSCSCWYFVSGVVSLRRVPKSEKIWISANYFAEQKSIVFSRPNYVLTKIAKFEKFQFYGCPEFFPRLNDKIRGILQFGYVWSEKRK